MTPEGPRVHLDRGDGLPRCGRPAGVPVAALPGVTCLYCLNLAAGVHGLGHRKAEAPHGTAARYRWHLRHEGKPVRCQPCLDAERIRNYRRTP